MTKWTVCLTSLKNIMSCQIYKVKENPTRATLNIGFLCCLVRTKFSKCTTFTVIVDKWNVFFFFCILIRDSFKMKYVHVCQWWSTSKSTFDTWEWDYSFIIISTKFTLNMRSVLLLAKSRGSVLIDWCQQMAVDQRNGECESFWFLARI